MLQIIQLIFSTAPTISFDDLFEHTVKAMIIKYQHVPQSRNLSCIGGEVSQMPVKWLSDNI